MSETKENIMLNLLLNIDNKYDTSEGTFFL